MAKCVEGVIIAVEEERFRMVTPDGVGLLLTLKKNAQLPADLDELARSRAPVLVIYEGQPNLSNGMVRRIKRIEQ